MRSIVRLRLTSASTHRKHTPTSGCPSNRSRLPQTVRSPQHQQPGCGRAILVATESGLGHRDTSSDVLRPMRMLLPLGSVRVNSCMPQGMSSMM